MSQQQEAIAATRSWIGTRFHHQGRVKKTTNHRGGCDCIGLVLGVAQEVGLTFHGNPYHVFDRKDYPKQPDGRQLKQAFETFLTPVAKDNMQPADIIMFRFEKDPQHVGFYSDRDTVIHCYLQAKGVVEHRMDDYWKERIVGVFRFNDI